MKYESRRRKDNLRHLSRTELLELLLEQTTRVNALQARVTELEVELAARDLRYGRIGTLAEASLELGGVFEAADKAAQIYLDRLRELAGTSAGDGPADAGADGKSRD